jgi:hypothetical protein
LVNRTLYRRILDDRWTALLVATGIAVGAIAMAVALFARPAVHVSASQQAEFYSRAARAAEANRDSRAVVLWVGDNYASGTGAASAEKSDTGLTVTSMDWILNLDAQGGTGFVNNGHANNPRFQPLPGRLAQSAIENRADVVLIDAGRNDPDTRATVIAARKYLTRVHTAWPLAEVVLIAPYYLSMDVEVNPPLREFYRAQAKRLDTYLIDPVAEGWATSPKSLLSSDHIHPNPKGHKYIAKHLVADLKSMKLPDLQNAP